LSDGLGGDLGHLLKSSSLGARLESAWISDGSEAISPGLMALAFQDRLSLVLSGGDDYELLFTASIDQRDRLLDLAKRLETPLTRIGVIINTPGLQVLDAQGQALETPIQSYEHFS
jgi:thiamine-monophosphate kinase